MDLWYKIAYEVEKVYGGAVDSEDGFFICPECGEPIYREDWTSADFVVGDLYQGDLMCPICETVIVEED